MEIPNIWMSRKHSLYLARPKWNLTRKPYLLYFVIMINLSHAQMLRWRRIVTSGGPSNRRDAAIGYDSLRDMVVIFGGRSNDKVYSDTWLLSLSNNSWRRMNHSMGEPNAIYGSIHGHKRGKLIVAFGRGLEKGKVSSNIYMLDFNTTKWKVIQVTDAKLRKRYFAAGGMSGDDIYFSHGQGVDELYSDTLRLSTATGSLEELHGDISQYSPTSPHARYSHSGVILPDNRLLIFGGCLSGGKSGGPCPSSDSWIFDSSLRKWTRLDSCATARLHSKLVLMPNSTKTSYVAVLYGGLESSKQTVKIFNKELPERLTIFDSKSDKWQQISVGKDEKYGSPDLRYSHSMTTTKNGVVLFGGVKVNNGDLLNDIWILEGDESTARNSKTHGNCEGGQITLITIHGILMFVSWGILLQVSGFVARYFKSKMKLWYNLHRGFAIAGLALAIAGFGIGIASVRGSHFSTVHGAIGLDIMLAGLYQPLNAAFRPAEPKNGEKPKLWRRIWEISHKFTGRLSLVLALVNISLGLFFSLAHKAVWITWFVYMSLIGIAYVAGELTLKNIRNNNVKLAQIGHSIEVNSR